MACNALVHQEFTCYDPDVPPVRSAQGVPALTGDGLQFDLRPESTDSAAPIDLPLRDPVAAVPPTARPEAALFRESAPSGDSRRGFAAGMLVIGLLTGFVGGFLVAQRVGQPPAPPRIVEVPRPLPPAGGLATGSNSRVEPLPSVLPAQTFTESAAADLVPPVPVDQPEIVPPAPVVERPVAPPSPRVEAAPPQPVREARATVQVDSLPPGATVYMDDVRVGVTPMTVRNVGAGTNAVQTGARCRN